MVLGSKAIDLAAVGLHSRYQASCLVIGGRLVLSLLGCQDEISTSLDLLAIMSEPLLLFNRKYLVDTSWVLCRGKALVSAFPALELDTINLGGCCGNVYSFHSRGLLHHGGKIRGTCMKVSAIGGLRLKDLNSSLERGLVDPRQEETCVDANVYTSISIILEVLHLLEDLFMMGNVGLKVAVFKVPFILECV